MLTEEPEHVLPQHRVAALGRIVERRPEAVSNISCPRNADDRHREQQQERHQPGFIQVNTGNRISLTPGARMVRIVTMKLTAEATKAMPAICSPRE